MIASLLCVQGCELGAPQIRQLVDLQHGLGLTHLVLGELKRLIGDRTRRVLQEARAQQLQLCAKDPHLVLCLQRGGSGLAQGRYHPAENENPNRPQYQIHAAPPASHSTRGAQKARSGVGGAP